ncbi:CRISPR-associated protein Csh1 [Peptoniphilus koenoeneniae]|uniref:CRISPR-associated protein Csh1 n=1 Tax=Peptoniphilus koenoeneniae TaxID=507751 RepID=A0ABU0ATG7_9FIRM|nr:hypothetical protein [Peptoniphilus koenoeneniae]MDQ0274508.1 CRISPR-associated protein Csh1 [Peptoniphilus koenoeneniae]
MIKECIEIFQEELKKDPNLILKSYLPKDGKYILVTMKENEDWALSEPLTIKYDKKTKIIDGENSLNYDFIKYLDYHSNILDSNKSMDFKKLIQSSNYYSIFFKENIYPKEESAKIILSRIYELLDSGKFSLDKIDEEKSIFKEEIYAGLDFEDVEKFKKFFSSILRYFDTLKDPYTKYKDKESKVLYEENENILGIVNTEEVEKIRNWLIKNLDKFNLNPDNKTYFKIFFVYEDKEKTKRAYKREQERYLRSNSFNKNKYNKEIDGKIFGLSNNNMGLNEKKPYLSNFDRIINEPYLISTEDAEIQKTFFDYLDNLVRRQIYRVYFDIKREKILENDFDLNEDFKGYELLLYPDKNEAAILSYKQYTKNLFDIDITFKEYIKENYGKDAKEDDIKKQKSKYSYMTKRSDVMKNVDWVYFYNYFYKNRDSLENLNIKDGNLKLIIINHGQNALNFILNGKEKYFEKNLDSLMFDSIKYSLSNNYFNKAIAQFNYYLSFKDYFEKNIGGLFMTLQKDMKEKIRSGGNFEFESDEEFLFGIGQILRYLLDKSNIGDKNLTFIREYLDNDNPKKIVEKLKRLIVRYGHNIKVIKNSNLNGLISKVLSYEYKGKKVDDKYIICGFLDEVYIYNKKNNSEEKGNINE